jgi:hypothetical protein
MRSEPHAIAVTPASSNWPAAAYPPSTEKSECTMTGSSPSPAMARSYPSALRCAGTNRSGPTARPIRRWPSEARWDTASSAATASSAEI